MHYPKMGGSSSSPDDAGTRCVAFEKADGTNIWWGWGSDGKWSGFGCRRDEFSPAQCQEFNLAHPNLDGAILQFFALSGSLNDAVGRLKGLYESNNVPFTGVKVFTEFLGPNSFAGEHKADDPKRLVVFDAMIDGKLLPPEDFIEAFAGLPMPKIVYRGKFNGKFTQAVRKGQFDVIEGVVAKGVDKAGKVWMAKIKTDAYKERLKKTFGPKWGDFWE